MTRVRQLRKTKWAIQPINEMCTRARQPMHWTYCARELDNSQWKIFALGLDSSSWELYISLWKTFVLELGNSN